MLSIDTLSEELDILGFNPPENVLWKCLEICKNNEIEDAVEFAEAWMAYSVSKCDGAEPTVDLLKEMELHEYVNKKNKKIAKKTELIKPIIPSNDLLIYPQNDVSEDNVLGVYSSNTPKGKQPLSRIQNSQIGFSPVCYSPLTPNRKLNLENSSESGHVVYTFGSSKLVKQTNWDKDESKKPKNITIKSITPDMCDNETSNYMYDPLYERMTTDADIIYEIGQDIFNVLMGAEETSRSSEESKATIEISHIDGISTETQHCLGRIVCNPDNKDRKIGLIDFDDMKIRYASLEMGREKNGAVFPGQIAIVKGINSRGNIFHVENIYTDRPLIHSVSPTSLDKEISFVVASSPFTDKDDLLYEKLESLLQYCNENNPDIVIFTGPIIESRNDLIANTIAEEFDSYFKMIIDKIASNIKPSTEIIIVSSHEDIVSTFVFPTHRYKINDTYKNIHFMPDPCIIDVNDIKIGITSVDVVKHLADSEVTYGAPKDQIKRIFTYLFQQKSFYPLQPSDLDIPMDQNLLQKFGKIDTVPNIMICPSNLPVFIREINNCVCINPGHLTNNQPSDTNKFGTFARMVIHPPASSETVPFNYAVCQVIKS